jgi:hypothetical protein
MSARFIITPKKKKKIRRIVAEILQNKKNAKLEREYERQQRYIKLMEEYANMLRVLTETKQQLIEAKQESMAAHKIAIEAKTKIISITKFADISARLVDYKSKLCDNVLSNASLDERAKIQLLDKLYENLLIKSNELNEREKNIAAREAAKVN